MPGYDEQVADRETRAATRRDERAAAERDHAGYPVGTRTERPHSPDGWGSGR